MTYKYGEFSNNQITEVKQNLRKHIFFLLLIADPKTKDEYLNIDVISTFDSELTKLGGMNSLLFEPPELVKIMSLLEAALIEYKKDNFNFNKYRKLILDAGNEVLKIKEV